VLDAVRIALNARDIETGILRQLCDQYQANFDEVMTFTASVKGLNAASRLHWSMFAAVHVSLYVGVEAPGCWAATLHFIMPLSVSLSCMAADGGTCTLTYQTG